MLANSLGPMKQENHNYNLKKEEPADDQLESVDEEDGISWPRQKVQWLQHYMTMHFI